MTIEYFADHQNVVFIPALLALLVVTLAVCLPIVFAPALRQGSAGRRRGIVAVAGLLAVVGLVTAGWQAGVGVRRLGTERATVQQELRERYGIAFTTADVNELLDGGAPSHIEPALAAKVGLEYTTIKHTFRLVPDTNGDGRYGLVYGGQPVPQA